ncbi:MAG: helix-turn-helix transcriptional regulator [Syntrophorhabdaceae bacterium]|nr:helix-turn-helix transcriptional regulator [Syntrophorhabdaceae bacterium]MDD5242849.1 helix-turn-helix transcriptional regulator [Syntrophorhabdaceae bacterium]
MTNIKNITIIENLSRTALECSDTDEFRKEILRFLSGWFGCEQGIFLLARPNCPDRFNLNSVVKLNIVEKYWRNFREKYYKFSPFLKALPFAKTVMTVDDLIPYKAYENLEYYNETLKPQSIHHELAVQFRSGKILLGGLALYRSKNERNFSSTEKSKMEQAAFYLSTALERFILFDKVCKVQEIINSICTDLPYKGLIALDDRLEPIYMNDEARQLVSSLDTDEDNWQNYFISLPNNPNRQCIKPVKANGRGGDAGIKNNDSTAEKNAVEMAPFQLRVVRTSRGSEISVILLGQNESKPNACKKLAELGLTKREIEVVFLVSEGLKNSEIGQKLFISEYTVENHLRSIYEKLSVKNRTSLACELSRITRTDH